MNTGKGKVVLYLMRHGQTILNKAGRTQGWCDSILTKEGFDVAVNVGLGLQDINFKAIYSSDLGRAVKTAKIVLNENTASGKLKIKEVVGLREAYFGKYEGELDTVKTKDILSYLKLNSFEEVEAKYVFPEAFQNSIAALDETNEAEDYDTVVKRTMNSLEHICAENAKNNGGNVLIVTHGLVLSIIISYLDRNIKSTGIQNSSISKIIYEDGEFRIESVNDSSYYEKGVALKKR